MTSKKQCGTTRRLSSQSVLTDCACLLCQWPLLANLKLHIMARGFLLDNLNLVGKMPLLGRGKLVNL